MFYIFNIRLKKSISRVYPNIKLISINLGFFLSEKNSKMTCWTLMFPISLEGVTINMLWSSTLERRKKKCFSLLILPHPGPHTMYRPQTDASCIFHDWIKKKEEHYLVVMTSHFSAFLKITSCLNTSSTIRHLTLSPEPMQTKHRCQHSEWFLTPGPQKPDWRGEHPSALHAHRRSWPRE